MASCHDIEPRLGSFIDGVLSVEDRGKIAQHLESCAACRGLVRDLDRIRGLARELGPISPPDHIWLEIAGQVHAKRAPGTGPAPARTHRAAVWQWAGLAAALVVVTMAAYFVTYTPAGPAAGNPTPDAAVKAVADELKLAMEHYENAINQLQVLAKANDGTLDPVVAATLQKNLAVVDQAIAESRVALADNPASEPARESLFEALRRKVGVLQATVSLMNEMRKGNQAGAAEAASGLGRKS